MSTQRHPEGELSQDVPQIPTTTPLLETIHECVDKPGASQLTNRPPHDKKLRPATLETRVPVSHRFTRLNCLRTSKSRVTPSIEILLSFFCHLALPSSFLCLVPFHLVAPQG